MRAGSAARPQPLEPRGALVPMLRSSLILLSLLALASAPAGASAAPGQTTLFEAPSELLSDAQREQTLDEISALGVDTVRVLLYWNRVAPAAQDRARPAFDAADPAGYDWGAYDRLMAATARRDMSVLVTITGPGPVWATEGRRDQLTRPIPREFERFAEAAGRRYGGQVRTWSVWNEPNHPAFLMPQYARGKRPVSPGIYRRLFAAADRGLRRAGQARDTLLLGETAPRGTGKVVAPLTFLRGTLAAGRLAGADGYAHHAYTTTAGPSFVPRSSNDVTIGVLSRLTRELDRQGRAGRVRRSMPIYLTEFGVQSEPDPYAGVSLARQAEFLAISERIAYRNPRVRLFSQYLMRDDQPRAGAARSRYSGFESGLRTSDGIAKPAYEAFRLPLVADSRGSTVHLWGRVRPAAGPVVVTIEVLDRGRRTWTRLKDDRTDRHGTWTATTRARSGRRYRVVWVDAAGTRHTGPAVRQT